MGAKGPSGPYLVMELLEGHSLRTLLDDAGQIPLELTINIALQVCECLAEAHAHGQKVGCADHHRDGGQLQRVEDQPADRAIGGEAAQRQRGKHHTVHVIAGRLKVQPAPH